MPPDGAAPRRRLASRLSPGSNAAASVAPPDVVGGESQFTFAQVAQHSGPADCWVVVRDKVYDVTTWCACARKRWARGDEPGATTTSRVTEHSPFRLRRVPKHPGGALIYEAAGKDCTALFDSYHPLAVRCAHVQRLFLRQLSVHLAVSPPAHPPSPRLQRPAPQVLRRRRGCW